MRTMSLTSSCVLCSIDPKYGVFVEDISRLVTWETTYNAALVAQLAGSLTAEAMISGQAFPYVTQPHFEITGGFVDGMVRTTVPAPIKCESVRRQCRNDDFAHQHVLLSSFALKTGWNYDGTLCSSHH